MRKKIILKKPGINGRNIKIQMIIGIDWRSRGIKNRKREEWRIVFKFFLWGEGLLIRVGGIINKGGERGWGHEVYYKRCVMFYRADSAPP